jgi:hypothetical protein
MARFTASAECYLHRIEFWTTDATSGVAVRVYDDLVGGVTTNLLAARDGLDHAHAGYQSVALDEPLGLAAGQTVYVAVRFANVSYTLPLPVDVLGPTESATTFYSFDGDSWSDLAAYGVDAALRIRTSPEAALGVSPDGDDGPPAPPTATLRLEPAVPNPFNPRTVLAFVLPRPDAVQLAIYDLAGRRVRTLVTGELNGGRHTTTWAGIDDAGRAVPAGLYVARLATPNAIRSTKLVLLK